MCRFNQFFGLSLLNCSFRSELLHARAGALCLHFCGLSLMESYTFNALYIVKNLTKTMEIIIDFFFIWKKCDIMICTLIEYSQHCLLEMIVKDGVCVWEGLDDIRRRRRSFCALKCF